MPEGCDSSNAADLRWRVSSLVALAGTWAIFCCLPALPVTSAEASLTADDIMRRVNARPAGEASRSQLDMVLRSAHGEYRKQITSERLRFETGYRSIYWITAPEHEKGIGLLLSEDAAQRGTWMYFPAAKQTVHVVSRGLPALASDFTGEDLQVKVSLSDYTFRLLGSEPMNGFVTYRIEMKPNNDRLRNELGYANSIGWVRGDIWMIARADYLDEDGVVFKTFHADNIEQTQGIWAAHKLTMQNSRAGHVTEVSVLAIDYSYRFPSDIFTLQHFGYGLLAPAK
jgi:hypothetical protein